MKQKRFRAALAAACSAALLVICGGSIGALPDPAPVRTAVSELAIPEGTRIVGLGEASHGVKEYQELKAEVFQTLVQNYGCRTFVIEGDFGNALRVDDYIHGGAGTAKKAAAKIGFRIYRTKEMEALLDWMRAYNAAAPAGKDLHFRGMDMQQADGSKEYLFRVLRESGLAFGEAYEAELAFLTDAKLYDLDAAAFQRGQAAAERLLRELDASRERIEAVSGAEAFAYARECAHSLSQCCEVRGSAGASYNVLRDRYMAEKARWIADRADGMIFLNGHNGHIGKANFTALYDCMGKLLAEELGGGYFAIGTDAGITEFQSQTSAGFEVRTATNRNPLNELAEQVGGRYYVAFSDTAKAERWDQLLSEPLRITTLNAGSSTLFKALYTTKIVPQDTFDGMIVFDRVSPTTLSE